MDRIVGILVETFGNSGTAILIIVFIGFALWLKFGKRK